MLRWFLNPIVFLSLVWSAPSGVQRRMGRCQVFIQATTPAATPTEAGSKGDELGLQAATMSIADGLRYYNTTPP